LANGDSAANIVFSGRRTRLLKRDPSTAKPGYTDPIFRARFVFARSKTNFDPDATFSAPGSGLAGGWVFAAITPAVRARTGAALRRLTQQLGCTSVPASEHRC